MVMQSSIPIESPCGESEAETPARWQTPDTILDSAVFEVSQQSPQSDLTWGNCQKTSQKEMLLLSK